MLIWETIKITFKQFYFNAFQLVIINLIWSFITGFLILFGLSGLQTGLWFLMIFPLILAGPFFMSMLAIAVKAYKDQDIKILESFKGIKKYFKRGLKSFLFFLIFYILFIINIEFFLYMGLENIFVFVFFVINIFIGICFTIMQMYFWGLLILNKNEGIYLSFKRAFVLFFDNLFYSILWFLFLSILLLIAYNLIAGAIPVLITLVSIYIITGNRLILEEYGNKKIDNNL